MYKISFDVFLAAGFILTSWVPYLTTNLGSIAAKVFFCVWFLVTWGVKPSACFKLRYGKATLISFFGYALTYALYIHFTDSPENMYYGVSTSTLKGYVWTICYWLMLHYYVSVRNGRALKQLALIFILGVVVTALMTLRGYTEFGDTISRAMVVMDAESDREQSLDTFSAAQKGVGSFSQVYGMVLMVMPLFYSTRYVPSRWKYGIAFVALLLTYCVFKAAFLTAVLTLAFSFLVLISVRQKSLPAPLIWGGGIAVVALFVIVSPYIVLPILDSVEMWKWVQHNEVYMSKVQTFQEVFSTQNYLEISRFERIQWSWSVFEKSPFLGSGFREVDLGGHSEIFDHLGRFGLIGVLPLVCFLYWINKYLNTHIYGLNPIYMRLKKTLILPLIFVAIFNPVGHGNAWSVYLFLVPILPLFYRVNSIGLCGGLKNGMTQLPWWFAKAKSDQKQSGR